MPLGAGRYDDLCTHVRETAKAQAAIIIIFGGEHGAGFSCQASAAITAALPEILEAVARDMRANMAAAEPTPDA